MDAIYTPSPISRYAGNPLIEALPPVLDDLEIIERLSSYPPILDQERILPPKDRMACVLALYDVFQPTFFHVRVARVLSTLLREGYHGRNPFDPSTLAHSHWLATQGRDGVPPPHPRKLTARSMFITGLSRMGKTRSIERILSLYPQVITHTRYKDQPLPLTQVTWLKVSTPKNGSLRELGLAFFMALDELFGGDQYTRGAMSQSRGSAMPLLPLVRKRARELNLGFLVVDELQRLSLLRSKGKTEIQKFLHALIDEVGIPVTFIGTYQAYEVFSGSLQETTRIAGSGSYELEQPTRGSGEWEFLVDTLWRFQWLKNPKPLSPAIIDLLYELTQGVTEILVTLLVIAQWRAMCNEEECLSDGLLRETSQKELGLLKAPLEALAAGDPERSYEDIIPPTDLRSEVAASAYDGLLQWTIKREVDKAVEQRMSDAAAPKPVDDNGQAILEKQVEGAPTIKGIPRGQTAAGDPVDLRQAAQNTDVLGELAKSGTLLTSLATFDPALKRQDDGSESNER